MLWWISGYICLFQFCFLWGVCKQWNCWVMQQFCFQVFKNSYGLLWLYPFALRPAVKMITFHSLSSISSLRCLGDGHCDQHEMIPHCGFEFHLSDNEWCWASFMCTLAICISPLEKCLFSYFAQFFIRLLFWFWTAWAACIFDRLTLGQLFGLL